MHNKFISFVCLVLTFALTSTTYATLPRVVGDFEDSNDYWSDFEKGGATLSPYYGNATLNDWSLQVSAVESGQWKNSPGLWISTSEGPMADLPDEYIIALLGDVEAATGIHVEVTMIASEWAVGTKGFVNVIDGFVLQTDYDSWQQFNTGTEKEWHGASDEGNYDETFSFDFIYPDQGEITYAKLWFAPLYNNVDTGGYFYFDNVYLIPEPTTVALLGLGGLALLRRRKR